jgi:SH3-like domain-containing protein
MVRVLRLAVIIAAITMTSAVTFHTPPAPAGAQDASLSCASQYENALVDMMAHCFGAQAGTVCAASGDVTITMASGQSVTEPGSTARIGGVGSLRLGTGDGSAWSLATVNLADPFNNRLQATLVALGPVELTFVETADLPAGAAFTLQTANAPTCSDLPYPGVLIQSPEGSLTMLRINDTDVAVNGMTLISTRSGGTLQVNALTRETILGQSGTVIFAGYTTSAMGAFAGDVTPYDASKVANLPIEILPEMQRVTLPGNATLKQEMNLFFEPGAEFYSSTMVSPGIPVTVFGRDSSGDWLHIRTYEGFEGWMPAYVMNVNVAGDMPVYDVAPLAPIRPFGSIQGYIKTSYENNNLRSGPGEQFEIVQTVPIWTDLALYGRSLDDEWLLVETLDGQRAWINTLIVSQSTPYAIEELPYPPDLVP